MHRKAVRNISVGLKCRRGPVTPSEAAYLLGRYGHHSLQAMALIAGAHRADIQRAILRAERGEPTAANETLFQTRRCHDTKAPTETLPRIASLSLSEAAQAFGLSAGTLQAWLIQERWIRRTKSGSLIAGAAKLTACLLNQPVAQVEVGRGVRMYYGAIRFTPRGMDNLRTALGAAVEPVR